MTEDQAAMTPEDRLAQNLCAECCADLTAIDVPHHMMQHWPQFIRPDGLNAEAIRRQGLMQQYADAHPTGAKAQKREAEHPQTGSRSESKSSTPPPPSKL